MGAERKTTNVVNIIIILFIVVIFALIIKNYASELLSSENINLSENSQDYTENLAGSNNYEHFNTTDFAPEDAPNQPLSDATADNKKDFSLDFNFGKKSVNKYTRWLYLIANVPEFILYDVFGLQQEGFMWIISILDWFWRIIISIAIVYFIRGIVR